VDLCGSLWIFVDICGYSIQSYLHAGRPVNVFLSVLVYISLIISSLTKSLRNIGFCYLFSGFVCEFGKELLHWCYIINKILIHLSLIYILFFTLCIL
jgi:hypothetical protein